MALLLAGCASTPPQPAEPEGPSVFESCHMHDEHEVLVLDETRHLLHETVCGASLWFDSLFGQGDIKSARSTRGRLEVAVSHSEFEGTDARVRFHARVRLPTLEQRVSAFIGRDDEEDFARDRTEGLGLRNELTELDDAEDWFAGLGYTLGKAGIKTDFRVGVRGLRDTKVFAQERVSWLAYQDDLNLVQLRGTPFVNNRDGWGFTLTADFDHALAPTRLLRWNTAGTATEMSQGIEWRSAVLIYHNLGEQRSIAPEIFWRGATAAPESLLEYGVRTILRVPMIKARLFTNLIPGYSYPRLDPALPRDGSFNFTLGLELPFGEQR